MPIELGVCPVVPYLMFPAPLEVNTMSVSSSQQGGDEVEKVKLLDKTAVLSSKSKKVNKSLDLVGDRPGIGT